MRGVVGHQAPPVGSLQPGTFLKYLSFGCCLQPMIKCRTSPTSALVPAGRDTTMSGYMNFAFPAGDESDASSDEWDIGRSDRKSPAIKVTRKAAVRH